jgi:hypothetical protein
MDEVEPRGCIVALEEGAAWPTRTFATIEDRDRVDVVHQQPGEAPHDFMMRLRDKCCSMQAAGVTLGTAVLSCSNCPNEAIARSLANRLGAEAGGQLVLVTDARRAGGANELLGLADSLLGSAAGTDLSIVVRAERSRAQGHRPQPGPSYVRGLRVPAPPRAAAAAH